MLRHEKLKRNLVDSFRCDAVASLQNKACTPSVASMLCYVPVTHCATLSAERVYPALQRRLNYCYMRNSETNFRTNIESS